MIADDYESIRTRMEEIAAERLKEPGPAGAVTLTGQSITLTNANIPSLTLDWSIYAPVNFAGFQLPDLRGRVKASG